jgi:GntR family transcriptional repressor for pyruvate dehydrogenase complex
VDTAADRAAGGIRALIVSREYGPGDRLPAERDLAQRLGLSRPALREGIRRLRSGGVLESRRGSGTYVSVVDLESIYDIRMRLEPLATERAALRRTDDELAEMQEAVGLMARNIELPDLFNFHDVHFHNLVADASESPVLRGMLDRLAELALLTRAVIAPKREFREQALVDVERIVLAVERQHPKRAANAMERHIRNVLDNYRSVVTEPRRYGTDARMPLDSRPIAS